MDCRRSEIPVDVSGRVGLAAWKFWTSIHPVTIVLLVSALIANWSTDRRKYILVTLIGYAAILGVTAIYFVPELMALTGTAYSPTTDAELTGRANNWEIFSLIRLGALLVLAVGLLFGLSKQIEENRNGVRAGASPPS